MTATREGLWRVTGINGGKERTVRLRALNHKLAVRRASHHPYMMVVRSCVLIDDQPEKSRQAAIEAARLLSKGVTQ